MPARDARGRFTSGGSLGDATGTIVIDYNGSGIAAAKRDLDGVGKSAGASARQMSQAGRLMAGAGAVIAGGFLLALKSAADFQHQMSAIQAVSGATAADMEKVRQKALQLGKDTKFSAGEAGQAIEELVKAGISLPDVMNGAADATVALAAAGEIDLPTAATIASNAMNQFGLAAEQLPHVADQLAGAANASAISVTDLGESLQYVGPVAKAVGVGINDVSTAIAILGNNGIRGSSAGTALRSVLSNLVPTTKKATTEFKNLGLITKDGTNLFVDANGAIKPLDQVVQILNDHTASLSKTAKNTFAKKSFGLETLSAVSVLAAQTSTSFDDMAASIDKTSAADVAAQRMNNLEGSMEQLKGSFETFMIVVGTPFLNSIRHIVDAVNGVIGVFLQMPGPIRDIIGILGGLSGAFLLVSGGALLIIPKLIEMKRTFDLLAETAVFQRIVSNIGMVATALTGPWGIALAVAVTALSALFFANRKGKQSFDDLTDAIKADGNALGDATRKAVAQRLETAGALETAQKYGISLSDLTSAALDNADAQGRVAAAVADAKTKLEAQQAAVLSRVNTGGDLDSQLVQEADGYQNQINALDRLTGSYKDNSKGALGSLAEAKRLADAAAESTTANTKQTASQNRVNEALGRAASQAASADGPAKVLRGTVKDLGSTSDATAKEIKSLNDNIKALFDTAFGAPRALDAFHEKLNALKSEVKDNGTNIRGFTDGAIKNRDALYNAAEGIGEYASQLLNIGTAPEDVAAKVATMRDQLIRQAGAAGLSRSQVKSLLDTLNDLPGVIDVQVNTDTAAAMSKAQKLKALLNSFHDITANVNVRAHTSNLRELEQAAGQPQMALGGIVSRATHVIAGEAGPEAITPLPDLASSFLRVFQAGQTTIAGAGMASGGIRSTGGGSRQPTSHRIISGRLSIDKSGHAFIRGVAEDVYDGNEQFAGAYARMG